MSFTVFASVSDLEERMGRELSQYEKDIAVTLLQDSSTYLIMEYKRCDKDVPYEDKDAMQALKLVVCNMAKRILVKPEASQMYGQDIKSMRTDVGPFSETFEFSNPDGSIFLRAAERKMLDLYEKSRIRPIRLGDK